MSSKAKAIKTSLSPISRDRYYVTSKPRVICDLMNLLLSLARIIDEAFVKSGIKIRSVEATAIFNLHANKRNECQAEVKDCPWNEVVDDQVRLINSMSNFTAATLVFNLKNIKIVSSRLS